ncbi:MAG TPA: pyridoxal phosphate-dependent aminotransferase, partial [Patescibacteria group bacterium]|nr:pyridoxal phosphate-dependent aminotransferase [Patescibacteria group bacterium]
MPQFAKRATNMPASPIRKLMTIAIERQKKGIHVYQLNIGQPDIPTPQEFFQAVHTFQENPVAYAPSQGIEQLIDAWRTYYAQLGFSIARNELMITAGGSEALIFTFAAVTDPGDDILVFEPFYTSYNGYATLIGATLTPVTLDIQNNFHLPHDAEIERHITSRTRALLICNPSNPTGTVFTTEELQRLVRIALKHDLYIIADEVYREFTFDASPTSLLSFPEASNHTIIIDSTSKRFNMCGARIGAIVSHNTELIASLIRFGMARLSVATIEQRAVIPVLHQAQKLIPPVILEYRKRRDVVYEELQRIPGVTSLKPEGAFYCMCTLPIDSSERFAKWTIEEFEENKETVLVAPAPGFYATPGKGAKEIRI